MAKSEAKHHPPALKRYRENHPTVSIVLTKDTKDALDKARGDMSYAEFLKFLFIPDGIFAQFQKEKADLENEIKKQKVRLAADRATFESEIKKQRIQLASEKANLEIEIKEQGAQLEAEWFSLKKEKKRLDKIERVFIPCGVCGDSILLQNTDPQWNRLLKPLLHNREIIQLYHKTCVGVNRL